MFEQITPWDSAVLHGMQSSANPVLDIAMFAITLLGNPFFWIMVAAFFYWKGKENDSFHLINLIALCSLFAGALKTIVSRARPPVEQFRAIAFDTFETSAFPSGHATLSTAAFFFLRKKLKRIIATAFVFLVILVPLSRIYLGAHYPSDAIAGIILGAIIGIFYLKFVEKFEHKKLHLSKSQDAFAIIILLAATIIAIGWLQSIPLGAALIGYYIGFFYLKEIGLHEKRLSGKKHLAKQTIGFIGIAAILLSAVLNPSAQLLAYGIAGFWISFLWPIIFEKVIRHG